jgi:hypothetical protein
MPSRIKNTSTIMLFRQGVSFLFPARADIELSSGVFQCKVLGGAWRGQWFSIPDDMRWGIRPVPAIFDRTDCMNDAFDGLEGEATINLAIAVL